MDFRKFLKNNWKLAAIFTFTTSFFLIQRYIDGVHWDFALYISNARYFFAGGSFIEWWVSPLAPFLMGLSSSFGWLLADYVYIFAISLLFLLACVKFSESFKVDEIMLYAVMANAYTLLYGLRNGTELLSLSMLMLFFSYAVKKDGNVKSSFFMALAILARYNNILLMPFVLINRNIRKTAVSLASVIATMSPWFLFNYVKTGNPFYSIADYYVLVNLQKNYYSNQALQTASIVLLAVLVCSLFVFRKRASRSGITNLSMLLLGAVTVLSFMNIPFMDIRYLFVLVLPGSYFFVKFFQKFKQAVPAILVFNIITAFLVLSLQPMSEDSGFVINGLDNCALMSNAWVYFDYRGIPCEQYPLEYEVRKRIDEGYRIAIFKWVREPTYGGNDTFLAQFPNITGTKNYVVLGNSSLCKKRYEINTTFTERKNDYLTTERDVMIQDEIGCEKNILSKALCLVLMI